MNKKDLPLLIALVGLWLAWPHIYNKFFKKPVPPGVETSQAVAEPEDEAGVAAPAEAEPEWAAAPDDETEPPVVHPLLEEEEEASGEPEERVVLEDDAVRVTLSSHGATVRHALLKSYSESAEPDSPPVELHFDASPALGYRGLPGLGTRNGFTVTPSSDGQAAVFKRTTASGLTLVREVSLESGYLLKVVDTYSGSQAVLLPEHGLTLGGMGLMPFENKPSAGMIFLGVDTLSQSNQKVMHWGKKLPKWLKAAGSDQVSRAIDHPSDWLAVKNKFFVQILTPKGGLDDAVVSVSRDPVTEEISRVAAVASFPAVQVTTDEPFVREFTYYVGPKKLKVLKAYGLHQTKVMELGWAGSIGSVLLTILNFIHDHLWPYNYGLAIMLLTIVIRVVFWPLTHKGTENMKRMQELQPQMKELREKYKDNAQKQQQEIMLLYKKNKVNPMMGCLPMLIQIPVFIALFYVLRSAIELRFAGFLWISDLSEPENLIPFGFTIPILGWEALNILPLLMSATTILQQKLTPTAGDPSQQKMMMMMPFIMLFFLYNFASGLVLYWTTNNVLMIVQQLLQRRRARQGAAAAA
jgi:YidC/Oxa1 family membrane protein insertase